MSHKRICISCHLKWHISRTVQRYTLYIDPLFSTESKWYFVLTPYFADWFSGNIASKNWNSTNSQLRYIVLCNRCNSGSTTNVKVWFEYHYLKSTPTFIVKFSEIPSGLWCPLLLSLLENRPNHVVTKILIPLWTFTGKR